MTGRGFRCYSMPTSWTFTSLLPLISSSFPCRRFISQPARDPRLWLKDGSKNPLAFSTKAFSSASNVEVTSLTTNDNSKTNEDSLTVVERGKAIIRSRISGVFTTIASTAQGNSNLFGSLMPYILDEGIVPHIGLHPNEQHAYHLQQIEVASLVVRSLTPPHISPNEVPLPKLNIQCTPRLVKDKWQIDYLKSQFIATHPASRPYVDSYKFYRLQPKEFMLFFDGQMIPFTFEDYLLAALDPLSSNLREMTENLNLQTHQLEVLCREYGGATYDFQDAFVYWIDRFGFNICARGYEVFDPVKFSKAAHEPDSLTQPQWIDYRMPFPVPMGRPEDAMAAINEAVAEIINRKPPS